MLGLRAENLLVQPVPCDAVLRLLVNGSHFGVPMAVSYVKMKANQHTNYMDMLICFY